MRGIFRGGAAGYGGTRLHFELMCAAVLIVEDHRVEAGAASAGGYRDGVEVQLYGDDPALVPLAHLPGDVEDEGGVHAVVELHRHVHVVTVGVAHLVGAGDAVGAESADAEGHQSSAHDVDRLAALLAVVLQSHAVADGDGVVACCAGVQVGGACHSREVGRAVDGRDAPVVVVQDDLREVDIGDGVQLHVELLHVDVAQGVVDESCEVGAHLDVLVVGGEEWLRLVEGVDVAWCVVACGVHAGVGVGGDAVERGLLVEDEALHAVEGLNLVPDEDVPEAPLVGGLEVCALHLVGIDAVVASLGVVAGVVASQVEDLGLGVAQLAEDAPVFVVPAVVPLGLPVVVDAEGEVVVPIDLEVEVDDGDVEGGLLGVVEVEGRFGGAGEEEKEDPPPAPPCEGGEYIVLTICGYCLLHWFFIINSLLLILHY